MEGTQKALKTKKMSSYQKMKARYLNQIETLNSDIKALTKEPTSKEEVMNLFIVKTKYNMRDEFVKLVMFGDSTSGVEMKGVYDKITTKDFK